jgi:putative membrane protein
MSSHFFNSGLSAFFSHFLIAMLLLALFIAIYVRITPYKEITLIRAGNVAAAISLSGSMLGFAVALASAIANSISLFDMLTWGSIALVVQLLAFLLTRVMLPDIVSDIPQNKTASGIFLGAASFALGLLNAACMTY